MAFIFYLTREKSILMMCRVLKPVQNMLRKVELTCHHVALLSCRRHLEVHLKNFKLDVVSPILIIRAV
jgi:hypothetical protein